MYPILYRSENIIIDSYSVFFILAWIVGGVVFYKEFRRRGWELEKMLFVMAGCVVGAVIGSFLLRSIFFPIREEIPHGPRMLNFAGKTVLGGIAGGFIGVELTKKIIGYPYSTGDAFAVAIPLGHAIGRIGCFLGGCCFGTECSLPWAVSYPAGTFPYLLHIAQGKIPEGAKASLAVHPTQIYEILFNLALFGFLWKKKDAFKVRGSLFRLYLVLYGTFRFLTEFIRGDSPFPTGGGLKPIQYGLLASALYWGWVFYKNEIKKKVLPLKE
ncbi:prolipoprotein diacylglyceryl transferase [Candidatus Poribacteria bacterium]|nr:prolipoprotein diacylglyceryl transferase [Candidatus Poribacteria bacterium]